MKLLKESINYNNCDLTEEQVADFIACHLPSEDCVKAKIVEINPGFDYQENIYFKIKDKIESVIRSTIEEFSCDEADAVSYIDIVFDDIKAHTFNDPELESIYDVKEPVEVVEEPTTEIEVIEEQPLEEAVQVQHFRITYKHETGIYATDAVEAPTYDEAIKIFKERGKGELISCDPISKEEYDEIIEGLGTEPIEESADESRYHPSRYSRFWWGIIDSNNGLLMRVGPDADYSKPLDDAANKLLLFKSKAEAQEYIDKNLVESLTEDLNVNVDTEEQNINVAAEENAAVEVKVAPKEDCIGVECDAEAELAELAKDPKYSKAFAYLMNTLQGETIEEQPVAEEPEAEMVEEPIMESVEESSDENAEDNPQDDVPEGPEDMYVANTLNELTKSEYETINQYNDFLLTIQNMVTRPEGMPEEETFEPPFCPELAASINSVIKDILAEENKHIGQLQELLKKVSPNAENIEAGAEEAKEQIEEDPEKLTESVESAAQTLRDKSKDPEAKALIDAILNLLEERAPEQAEKVREVIEEVSKK